MIYLLLVVYQIKHYVADFPLQGAFMLGKFKKSPDFILPLLSHGAVHGAMTFLIALCFKSPMVAAAFGLTDMVVHCIIDRVKASPDLGGRFKALTKTDFEKHYGQVVELKRLVIGADVNEAIVLNSHLETIETDWDARLKSNKYFWWALGADQFAHHITHYAIIFGLLK